ncbi:hypothetical protein BBAD15_g3932 [Beauveria bassiana D1-5]|uniref:Uncharacterized protein n=1 Tax=Beauveria bassiana D1-5 TaxID=1245745 RepID=A0A0A2WCL2_BEABA|nr:hypothetical protein BBAD15_g3932 [Beauveria bassiana D1-5]
MVDWEVLDFSIGTSNAYQQSAQLYANGRMQVLVYVWISVQTKGTNQLYHLSPDELSEIALVDYNDPYNGLDRDGDMRGDWQYSEKPGEYAQPLPSSRVVGAATDLPQLARGSQTQKYWVTTTAQENKDIAASIYQPDGTLVNTTMAGFESRITLEGLTPIVYTTDKESTSVERKFIKQGTYHCDWEGSYDPYWSQDNYYFSLKQFPLHKVELHWYDRTGHDNGHDNDPCLVGAVAKQLQHDYQVSHSADLNVFFIWEHGTKSPTKSGLYRKWGNITANAYANIEVDQREQALCLTRLKFGFFPGLGEIWGTQWTFSTWFIVFDIHGNSGTFEVTLSEDHDSVVIQDSKRSLAIASSEKAAISKQEIKPSLHDKAKVEAAVEAFKEKYKA